MGPAFAEPGIVLPQAALCVEVNSVHRWTSHWEKRARRRNVSKIYAAQSTRSVYKYVPILLPLPGPFPVESTFKIAMLAPFTGPFRVGYIALDLDGINSVLQSN